MKRSIILITALLLAVAQGTWAQTVTTAGGLVDAVKTDNADIVLGADIQLESYLNIDGKTVTIDLNGHKLYRNIAGSHASDGHVIYVHNNATLTLANSKGTGSIEGGKALNGGAINIGPLCSVNTSDVTFRNNSASDHAGAIWNSGTLTATNCTFTNNSAGDVGAVYNAVVENTYFGAATFTGCTFTENTSSTSGGALANAKGNTSMILNNCTVSYNTANTNGGGIWNGGTLTFTGGIIGNCRAQSGGGAVYNEGTMTMTIASSRIVNLCSANEGGVIYNAAGATADISGEGQIRNCGSVSTLGTQTTSGGVIYNAGTLILGGILMEANSAGDGGVIYNAAGANATISSATFNSNNSTTYGGGAITNQGTLTVSGGNFTNNVSAGNGGGIYSNGTLNMSGNPVVRGNLKGSAKNNLYLAEDKKITVTGAFTSGAEIGLSSASGNLHLTKDYGTYCPGVDPENIFSSDSDDYGISLMDNEVIRYQKVSTISSSYLLEDGSTVAQNGCSRVSLLVDNPGVTMANGWYVVDESKSFDNRIQIVGTVHLILADGTTLNANKGIHVPHGSTFHVWGQSWPDVNTMGKLKADARSLEGYAGIGGDLHDFSGPLFFHGGNTTAYGGQAYNLGAAGIGGGASGSSSLITISGGSVAGYAGDNEHEGLGAGIGSGFSGICMGVTITGGLVSGLSTNGAGIGSGQDGFLHSIRGEYDPLPDGEEIYAITISGGAVIASSGFGAGIGGGLAQNRWAGLPGHIYIYGGQIRAYSWSGVNGAYHSQAIGHGELGQFDIAHEEVADFGRYLYDDAKVQAATSTEGDNLAPLPVADRLGVLQFANVYKQVFIDPCDHPNGLPCPYCGSSSMESLSLADASNNYSILHSHDAYTANVTLSGRTFWKDGSWNTLCLPFALENFTGTPLEGATVKALTGASVTDGVLTLTFGEAVTAIEGGKPYIVKWDSGENITDPVFNGVRVYNTSTGTKVGDVTFKGIFSPYSLTADDRTQLYLGADNKLYYATSALDVNSFRGYFVLGENLQPNAVSSLVMDFGEEPAGELNVVEE